MPNIAATKRQSITALFGDENLNENAIKLFSHIGKTVWMDNEKNFNIATAIVGSAPAFLAMVAQAISDGGVLCGISREKSQELTQGLFGSFYAILKEKHPQEIIHTVSSPGGITAEGLFKLEQANIRYAFTNAIKKTYEKSLKLNETAHCDKITSL